MRIVTFKLTGKANGKSLLLSVPASAVYVTERAAYNELERMGVPTKTSVQLGFLESPNNFYELDHEYGEAVDIWQGKRGDAFDAIGELYYELLGAVETKHEGETRHATALRYIQSCERGSDETAKVEDDNGK